MWFVVDCVGVIGVSHLECAGPYLHEGGLERVPPTSPGEPHDAVVRPGAVVAAGVVAAVQVGTVTPAEERSGRVQP